MKHTKGPWKTIVWTRHVRDHREELFQVIDIHGNKQYEGRQIANANLIAAAPEMLELLEQLLEWNVIDDAFAVEKIITLIKKIGG